MCGGEGACLEFDSWFWELISGWEDGVSLQWEEQCGTQVWLSEVGATTAALQLPLPLISCAFSWARLHGTVLVENSFLSLSPTVNSAERWQFSLDFAEDLMCWYCQSFADKTCVWAKQHHGWRLVAVLINQLSWLLGRSGAGIQVRAWISRFHLPLQTNLLKFSGL